MEAINTDDLTIEQMEAALEKKRKALKQKQQAEKQAYENDTNEKVEAIITTAKTMFTELSEFKQYCHIEMDKKALSLAQYGGIRSNSKGGFTITNKAGDMRVTRRRDTEPVWDERATKAIELIKDFLSDTIKKRDMKLYEILMGFLERNEKGDLEYNRVMDLYKHEDKFDDERWKEGLRLIKESYGSHLKGYGYEFKIKDSEGKWQGVLLNFSSL
ncbi:DUF3164 family protein [Flavobacterium cerinum]|nr:DUF3164 family protein [Flavobacterium cerinum]